MTRVASKKAKGANKTSCAEVPFFSSDHRPDGARLLFPAGQWTLRLSICSYLPRRALSSKIQAAVGLASAPSCRHGEDRCKREIHTNIPIALTHGTSSISISAVSATIPISAVVCSLSGMRLADMMLAEAARLGKSGQNYSNWERDSGRYPLKLPFPDPELPTPLPCPVLPLPPPGDAWGALLPKPSASPTGLSTRLYELTEPAVGNVTVSWVHPALSVFWAVPDPGSTQPQRFRKPSQQCRQTLCVSKMTDRSIKSGWLHFHILGFHMHPGQKILDIEGAGRSCSATQVHQQDIYAVTSSDEPALPGRAHRQCFTPRAGVSARDFQPARPGC